MRVCVCVSLCEYVCVYIYIYIYIYIYTLTHTHRNTVHKRQRILPSVALVTPGSTDIIATILTFIAFIVSRTYKEPWAKNAGTHDIERLS